MDTEPDIAPELLSQPEGDTGIFESSVPDDQPVNSKPDESEEPPPPLEEPTEKNVSDPEINLTEVKEQMLKEVEEMKNSDMSHLEVSQVVSAVEIEKLLDHKDTTTTNNKKLNDIDDNLYDTNPQVIIEDMKAALDELRELDILVCGGCHTVFHFIEDFNKHKPTCRRKSAFHGNIAETKPQVWAFLLWKNAQTKMNKQGLPIEESAWKLYQKWCKMPERIRNAWVAAGETVMNFSNFGFNKTIDNSLKLRKGDKGDSLDLSEDDERKPVVMRKLVHRDHHGEIKEIRPPATINKKKYDEIENIRNQLEDGDSSQDKDIEIVKGEIADATQLCEMKLLENPRRYNFRKKEQILKNEHETRVVKSRKKKKTKDGESSFQEEEFVVEKIVSRRFNPRKKQYEYLLKWEGYPSEQNTWEPAENLEACQHLLKAFEENLSKQSVNKSKPLARKNEHGMNQAGPSGLNSFGRPIRYSKQKALSQVKQWCGSIKPDDNELESLKRRMPGSDSDEEDDPYLKRIKLEKETDSEDSLGGRIVYSKNGTSGIIKRPGRGRPANPNRTRVANGAAAGDNLAVALGLESDGDEAETAKKSPLDLLRRPLVKSTTSTLSPANQQVLVANAKGVVKVDPAQVPNLSSGVYIMSNKSGIIKLDSVSPSKALSLKQGVPVREVPPSSLPPATKQSGSGSVVMVRQQAGATPRSGVMRKNQVSGVDVPGRPQVAASPQNIVKGPGRPPRPQSNIRINHPSTRLIHSGSSRSNITINHPGRPPRLPIRQDNEIERRVLGPKVTNTSRGGFSRGGYRGGRGGGGGGILARAANADLELNKNKPSMDNDMPDFSQPPSPASDLGEPDDFPVDLPPLEPDSPPRPLTLCPETGKVLLKAEGEKTPEPSPPPSPTPQSQTTTKSEQVIIKTEIEKDETILSKEANVKTQQQDVATSKEALIKKTLKPGAMGSVMVSPKKVLPDIEEENDNDDLVTITGDDGMIYKVSRTELNQTLMAQQGEDGQVTVYIQGEDGDAVLTLDPSTFEDDGTAAAAADSFVQPFRQVAAATGANATTASEMYVKEAEEAGQMVVGIQDGDGDDGQVVAQLVEAGEPAPGGGPRRVVLLLPDGNLMVTEVDEEQYAALELDK
ncbi:chromodomain-containing protein chromator isoform X3 [Rhodnius prolixus]